MSHHSLPFRRCLEGALRAGVGLCLMLVCSGLVPAWAQAPGVQLKATTLSQIAALAQEKAVRTPAQQKLDSQLIYAVKQSRNQVIANGVPNLKADVDLTDDGRVLVDMAATVTPALLGAIANAGGQVVNSFAQFNAIRALLPLSQIEALAARPDVRHIQRAAPLLTSGPTDAFAGRDSGTDDRRTPRPVAPPVAGSATLPRAGSVTSQGDVCHAANTARTNFGVNGTGVKVGLLSDSVGHRFASQASGDLPANLTIMPGQAGNGSGEGAAMLEIVHDLAPGAQLFYATANGGPANFAQNILDLRAAGCDIIVDDVSYANESPFQADVIAQAVNTVSAAGALYFSSAANSGNKNDGTSGTWEGDFVDGGAATGIAKPGRFHDFGGTIFNDATAGTSFGVALFWADPLGASTNDYDLYITDFSGNVLRSSTSTQNGTQDPFEFVGPLNAGESIVIVKFSGAARFLHLDTNRGQLAISTSGNTHGHNASGAANAFCVAATNVANSPGVPFSGGATNPVETFSSDGPRRVFFNANGTAITPGNFSSTGGQVLQKPDITAADGAASSAAFAASSGLNPFFGTSAAAPHAAAVAALLKSYNPTLTPAQIRTRLTSSALNIEAAGVDRDSGAGIVMAQQAIQGATALVSPRLVFSSATVTAGGGNGNGLIEKNECNLLNVTLHNAAPVAAGTATSIAATLSTSTSGVTIATASSAYPNIAGLANGTNTTSFRVSTAPGFFPGTLITFTLTATYTGGSDTIIFSLPSAQVAPSTKTGTLTAGDAQQTGRLNRNGVVSSNDNPKACPGVLDGVARSFDSYTFTNTGPDTAVIVEINNPSTSTNPILVAAYSGSFNPANLCTNYLADMGRSDAFNEMSFPVDAGATFVVVVNEITPGQGNPGYSLTVSGLVSGADGGGVCPVPGLSINDVTVTEGNAGTINATFTVTRVGDTSGAASVDFATSDGTATAGSDYTSKTGTVSFTAGQSSKPITVAVTGDALDEPNETFKVTLSNPSGSVIADNLGVGTIKDDDPTPVVSINDVTVGEGNSGTVNANFSLTLSAASGRAVTVTYKTADGTATAGQDYVAHPSTVLTFTPGQTSKPIVVQVKGDTFDEGIETFKVVLQAATFAAIPDTKGACTITDDDPLPSVSISDASVTEGDSGSKNALFTVTLTGATNRTVTVNYTTANGTATAGSDYTTKSGTITFTPGGPTSKTLPIAVLGDTTAEANETFKVNLGVNGSSFATLSDSQGLGTITNDD